MKTFKNSVQSELSKQVFSVSFPKTPAPPSPQEAFEKAISSGRLSTDKNHPNYAGFFMYMGNSNGKDQFKHSETRNYIN